MNRVAALLPAIVLLATSMLATTMPAFASEGCMPVAGDGWIRKPPADLPVMAGYARLENPCDAPVTIVSARSDAFADTSIHETRLEDGMSRMRATSSLLLPAGAEVGMAPGGLHLMLVNPTAPLQAGGTVSVEFTLDDGRKFQADFELRANR